MNPIATFQKVLKVKPHPNADRLELVYILGYQCVCLKGLYKEGDQVVYISTDSVLPKDKAWAEAYRKYSPKRIKACKLRGEWSEGVILPFAEFQTIVDQNFEFIEYLEVSDLLGIEHYEPPAPQDLSARGRLPYNIGKTDEARWESHINTLPFGDKVDVTLKIDGQSFSAFYHLGDKRFGVLGRTLELKTDRDNNYTRHIERYDLKNKLTNYCEKHNVSLCIRGESYGKGIQNHCNNPHALLENGLSIFSVYLIDERRYARIGDPFYFTKVCEDLSLPHVPILEENVTLDMNLINKYSNELQEINNAPFEGVVINHKQGSFKIISKDYDSRK